MASANKFIFNPFTGTFDAINKPDPSNNIIENVTCLTDVFVGAVVSFNGSGVVFNSLADSTSTCDVVGIVETKASSTLCDVRVCGITPEHYTSLDPTETYYLSDTTAGTLTTSVTTTSGNIIVPVARPVGTTRMAVQIQPRMIRA